MANGLIKVTALADITWTGRNNDKIVDKGVPFVASYNPSVVYTEHQRKRALMNWAEQVFRDSHKEYGKFGLTFGTCEVTLDGYYELG